jgi:hypothetical protein
MWRILSGVALMLLGVTAFLVGLQYASFMMPTDLDQVVRERYKLYSNIFGYCSYALFLGGIIVTAWAIRTKRRHHV